MVICPNVEHVTDLVYPKGFAHSEQRICADTSLTKIPITL